MARARVSLAVVKRLPKYYRYLGMIEQKGIIRVSSQELSSITGLTASQFLTRFKPFWWFWSTRIRIQCRRIKIRNRKNYGN